MSANRFFIPASSLEGEQVRLTREQSHQVSRVLRLRAGDAIVVLDDSGTEYDVTLTEVRPAQTLGRVTGRRPAPGEPTVEVTLLQSLLAREKFEWVLQKATEVGVTRFVPVLTERSLARTREIEDHKLDRWRRILKEAAEQSQRGRIPRLDPLVTFDDALTLLTDFDHVLIAVASGEGVGLRQALHGWSAERGAIGLMIGPEGGFTDGEVARAREKGVVAVGLGPRVLRTETAAVVAAALVLYELGEMGP
jgi:16S rRNA (uracil1498-N3)-methyltransferase